MVGLLQQDRRIVEEIIDNDPAYSGFPALPRGNRIKTLRCASASSHPFVLLVYLSGRCGHVSTLDNSVVSVRYGSFFAAHRKFLGVRFRAEENPIFGLKRDTYQYPDSFRALAPQS